MWSIPLSTTNNFIVLLLYDQHLDSTQNLKKSMEKKNKNELNHSLIKKKMVVPIKRQKGKKCWLDIAQLQ